VLVLLRHRRYLLPVDIRVIVGSWTYQAAEPGSLQDGRSPTGRRYSIHLSGETLVRKTTSFQRIGTAGLAALTLVGLLSACSSKKSATAASAASTASASAAAPAATSAAAPAAATPTVALPTKVVATGGGKFCQQVAAEVNNSVAKEAAAGNAADAVTSIKQSVQEFKAIEGSVLSSAPGAIKPDLVTLFGAIDQFYSALAAVNYDFTKVSPSVEAPLETPAVQAAEQNVDAYLKNTCGIDTGDTGGASAGAAAEASASAAEQSLLAELSAAAGSPSS
jgi:hypothetical protein